jgi:hypothetical protein
LWHAVAHDWDTLRHDAASTGHDIAHTFDVLRHDLGVAWSAVKNGIDNAVGWFKALPGRVLGALRGLGHSLYAFGHAALTELLNGFTSVAKSILGWLGGFVGKIVGLVGKLLRLGSPSGVFFDIGKNMMLGLANGIKAHAHTAANAARSAATTASQVANVGSGVQRWAPLVRQALRMEGLSPTLLHNVLYQMMTESGGNPNAINLTDVNARNGDPSRGLMQTIATTFSAYHWPGTSYDIFNPLANIAAALNYARHVYGPTLMSGGMGIGSGHGYDRGGWLMPGVTMAVNATGQPEQVLPGSGAGSMTEVAGLLRRTNQLLEGLPARVGAGLGRELNGAALSALR